MASRGGVVASVGVLLISLVLLWAISLRRLFTFREKTNPLWVTLLGVVAVLGVAVGFAGFFLLMAVAGWRSHRETRRVQVISPSHGDR